MKQNETKKRERAARLVAEDLLSDEKIAEQCGIGRVTLFRWKKEKSFSEAIEGYKKAAAVGINKAAEGKAFDTVARLIELANLGPGDTNGTIAGQVKACQTIAEIRGEIVQLHGDVTDRLKNKTQEELDFIAVNRRDPRDAEELRGFTEQRRQQIQ